MADWPFRWDHLLRYRYIEIISLWEGRLTTGHLTRCFGIGRQQASKDINLYVRDIAIAPPTPSHRGSPGDLQTNTCT